MSKNYNSHIQTNNTDLQAILNTINELPEAGGAEPNLQDKTVTPGTIDKVISADKDYDGLKTVTVEGDSNLVSSNIVNGVEIFGITGTASGGNTEVEDGLIDGTLTSITNNRVTKIQPYAFYCHSYITEVNLNNVTQIGSNAFYSCTRLTNINLPNLLYMSNAAFEMCTSLSNISLPSIDTIPGRAFYRCYKLNNADFPNATFVAQSAFDQCTNLTYVSLPKVSMIMPSTFYLCTSLSQIRLPMLVTLYSAFNSCTNLTALILNGSSVCRLMYTYTFNSTPIGGYSTSAGKFGSIYVPRSLMAAYKSATNWTYFSSRFAAVEDLEN